MKKIKLGGARIFDTILNDKNKDFFKNIKRKEAPLVLEMELESARNTNSVLVKNKKQLAFAGGGNDFSPKAESIDFIDKTIHLQKEKNNSDMEISTIKNNTSADVRIGENGLRLHDFETGEHLKGKEIIFTQEDLEEFATGKIANVFGPEYAIIDTYGRRVMLPMDPYLLVSRVTGLKAERGKYEPSTMQTEYDIPYGAWFTTDRQIPWAVSVESGQCDLLLISYLGIDFENKGKLVYRLLDCTLTFTDDLPFEGQTLRYDISINSFVRNGDNLLFFFSYRCYVEDRLVLKMDGGCAGFFTPDQLSVGNGVVYSKSELEAKRLAKKRYFTPLLNTKKRSFSKEDLRHLIAGDMEKCFDDISYFANGRNPSLCLPPEKILMLDRITSVDMTGGAYGLGYIVAEKDLRPDDWYFPCHFRDDEVLAGSLQAEGGGNLLRFFMLMLGLQRVMKDARYQPVFDVPQKVRCRKEVTPKDTKLIYTLEIKEIGLVPNPYVIGDLEILSADGVVTVHFENLGLQLREKTNPKYLEETAGVKISPRSEGALLNELDITRFALDDLSKAFGEDFAVYDGRKVSRQPNTDLQLISRVMSVDGKRGDFSKPSKIHAEYDVPVDAWYYQQNAAMTMPYSILMEIALQPCGLLGAYLGSTLQFADQNLYFRNLDGNGEMFDLPSGTDFRGKTITNHAVLVSSVAMGGIILQNYTFECSIDGYVFYKGKSSFGFFPAEALATQVGLDGGKNVDAWYITNNLQTTDYMKIKLDSLYGKMKLYKAPAEKPHYRLAEDQLNLLDNLIIAKNSGKYGKGYIHATKYVMPYEWFYTCHFYQDPVMPGSLGVEAILQAMQVFALQQDLGKDFVNPKFVQVPSHETVWKYRGQILTHVREMQLEVHIQSIEKIDGRLVMIADTSLWNDEVRIYEVTGLALGIEEG
ncbi:MAG TPA: PfaB family protein, partial [Phaeodactylibacter sp.]|nr:PfaB family protein [Phaeodactylibacter sp.]